MRIPGRIRNKVAVVYIFNLYCLEDYFLVVENLLIVYKTVARRRILLFLIVFGNVLL